MNHTQIIGWLGRRLTLNEAKKLQGFDENYQLSENRALHMKQLGNAVNVNVVAEILKFNSTLRKLFTKDSSHQT